MQVFNELTPECDIITQMYAGGYEKTVEMNLQEFERIRQKNENLLRINNKNYKALKFFDKLFK